MSRWWLCPNKPQCPHGSVLHDIEDMEDQTPRCCVEGCDCGNEQAPGMPRPICAASEGNDECDPSEPGGHCSCYVTDEACCWCGEAFDDARSRLPVSQAANS